MRTKRLWWFIVRAVHQTRRVWAHALLGNTLPGMPKPQEWIPIDQAQLAAIIHAWAALRLPPPDILAVATQDGKEWFVAAEWRHEFPVLTNITFCAPPVFMRRSVSPGPDRILEFTTLEERLAEVKS